MIFPVIPGVQASVELELRRRLDEQEKRLAQMQHDLRAPLNVLQLTLDSLRPDKLSAEKIDVLARNVKKLADLVDAVSGSPQAGPQKEEGSKPRLRRGIRVLVVEDEYLLAQAVSDCLSAADCEVVGPVGNLEEALRRVEEHALDCALMDANLGGSFSLPVVAALAGRGVPTAIISGYDRAALPTELKALPFLQKPVESRELLQLVAKLIAVPDPCGNTSDRN